MAARETKQLSPEQWERWWAGWKGPHMATLQRASWLFSQRQFHTGHSDSGYDGLQWPMLKEQVHAALKQTIAEISQWRQR